MAFNLCRLLVMLLHLLNLSEPIYNPAISVDTLYDEKIAVLETLGLHFPQEDIDRLKTNYTELMEALPADIDTRMFTDYPQLLSVLGGCELDQETWRYHPRSNSVYSFDAECLDMDSAYEDFLIGIAHISGGEIIVADYQSHVDESTFEKGMGEQIVRFKMNDEECTFTASFYYDWLDCCILDYINEILARQGTEKRLWCMSDQGQGLIVFYNTQSWANEFHAKTQYQLYAAVTDIGW